MQAGQTIVLVEQNLAATLAFAHRAYIINNGHITHDGRAQEIKARLEILQRYLACRRLSFAIERTSARAQRFQIWVMRYRAVSMGVRLARWKVRFPDCLSAGTAPT